MSTPTVAQTQYTPDNSWGAVTARRHQPRRPLTRIGRAIRKLLGQWWVHTSYCGAILGVAVYGIFATPAYADDQVLTFSAPAVKYVAEHGVEVCTTLDEASAAQVGELLHKLEWLGGLTTQQAGEALYFSVLSICPIHFELLDAYASQGAVVEVA